HVSRLMYKLVLMVIVTFYSYNCLFFLYFVIFTIFFFFFFFNDTATTEIYTLSLHDALPITRRMFGATRSTRPYSMPSSAGTNGRSEEHTSELQSRGHLVCRLLLEKKKKKKKKILQLHSKIKVNKHQ